MKTVKIFLCLLWGNKTHLIFYLIYYDKIYIISWNLKLREFELKYNFSLTKFFLSLFLFIELENCNALFLFSSFMAIYIRIFNLLLLFKIYEATNINFLEK